MELAAYIFLYLLTTTFAIFPKILKEKNFFIFWFVVVIGTSIIIRSTIGEMDGDIEAYVTIMSTFNWNWTPNLIREFIFWSSVQFLYSIFNNGIVVFVILDFILFALLYLGFNLNKKRFFPNIDNFNTRYIFFGLFLFFPYVVGMHSLYRQLFATALFICAIGYTTNQKLFKSFIFLVISIFVHNLTAVFSPLLLFMTNKLKYKSLSVVVLFIMPSALFFSENTNNEYIVRHDIYYGATLTYTFLFFLYFIVIAVLILNIFKTPNRKNKHGTFSVYLLIVAIIYGISFYSLNSSLSIERFAIFIFSLIFPLIAYYIEDRFSDKIITRLVYFNIAILPIFIFYNSIIKVEL